MRQKLNNVLAICIGILPFNILMVWYRLTHPEGFTTVDMLVYPIVFGGGLTVVILALNKYLLKQQIDIFDRRKEKWLLNIPIGMALTAVYFLLVVIERKTIGEFLPQGKPPSHEVINLMISLARNPLLLAIWLGPVVWIGVAMFEEVQRIFLINCLWVLSRNKTWEWLVIFIVSVICGLMHLYQGMFGIISISIQGLIMGFYYLKFRRIWPLIISHALYDSIQIMLFTIQFS